MSVLLRSSIVIAAMTLCAGIGACSKKPAPPSPMPSSLSDAYSGMEKEKVASVQSDISQQAARMKVPVSEVTYFDAADKPISEAAFYEGLLANPKNAWKMVGKTGVTTNGGAPETKTASVTVHLMNAP